MTRARRNFPRAAWPTSQSGLSLMELLVAMTLGFMLLAGIGTVYLSSKQTYRTQEANARVQETGRFALEMIARNLRQAGAQGSMPADINATPESCVSTRPCTSTGTCGVVTGAPAGTTCVSLGGVCTATNYQCFAVQGANGASGAPDALAVQWFASVGGSVDCNGDPANSDDAVTSAFTVDTTDNELECVGRIVPSSGTVTSTTQPLAENIEDLQVLYGLDADGSGDESADSYVAAPTAAQWPSVVSARVCVQVRSSEQGVIAGANRYLNCAGALGVVSGSGTGAFTTNTTDTRLHRVFVTTVNLRNRIRSHP